MGLKTALASAIMPGLGQIINGERKRAVTIWTGLILSVLLFPLPLFGTPTFAGIWIAGIIDAYDPDKEFELISIRAWKQKGEEKVLHRIKRKYRKYKN